MIAKIKNKISNNKMIRMQFNFLLKCCVQNYVAFFSSLILCVFSGFMQKENLIIFFANILKIEFWFMMRSISSMGNRKFEYHKNLDNFMHFLHKTIQFTYGVSINFNQIRF